jgi:hypothetical protein
VLPAARRLLLLLLRAPAVGLTCSQYPCLSRLGFTRFAVLALACLLPPVRVRGA